MVTDAERDNFTNTIASYKADRLKLSRAKRLLTDIYGMYGPRDGGALVPPRKFSKMTKGHVERTYDFPLRLLMHRIARELSN